MIKVFILQDKIKSSYVPLLYSNLGRIEKRNRLFENKASMGLTAKIFDVKDNIEEVDFLLVPYEYFSINNPDYIKKYISLSTKHNKKIIIFDFTDYDEEINVSNSIIFRTSQYRYKKRRRNNDRCNKIFNTKRYR